MKKRDRCPPPPPSSSSSSPLDASATGCSVNHGMDELLEVLGYKVRSSDMAQVAHKLEQLEEVIGTSHDDRHALSHLASETVHYNPSDISSWLETMLSELNPPPSSSLPSASAADDPYSASSTTLCDYDLKAIPGKAIYGDRGRDHSSAVVSAKRLRPCVSSFSSPPPQPPREWEQVLPGETAEEAVILVDSQENGIRLVHTLTACAEAVSEGDMKLGEVLVKQILHLAASQAGAMGKIATYFAEALAMRIYKVVPQVSPREMMVHFYEACPYLKFAHLTANQAILDAFAGKRRVHVVDLGVGEGMQWPALMQALALLPSGAPSFRLTGVGRGLAGEVGVRLAEMAETMSVRFEYRNVEVKELEELDEGELGLVEGETVAVNAVLELHRLVGRKGAVERLLKGMRRMKPEVVTVVELEANHNGAGFMERFMQALHYYSTLFDSMEGWVGGGGGEKGRAMAEVFLGRQICNIVACEGEERVERHETLERWGERMGRAGFRGVALGSNAFKQARMLLSLMDWGDGFRVEEKGGSLLLGWHTRPLISTSAWRPSY